jgi:hypothetical protein
MGLEQHPRPEGARLERDLGVHRQRTFEHPQGERSIGLELRDLHQRLELPSPAGAMDLAQPRPDTDRTLALGHSRDGVGLPGGALRRVGDVGKHLAPEAGNLGLDGEPDQAGATVFTEIDALV